MMKLTKIKDLKKGSIVLSMDEENPNIFYKGMFEGLDNGKAKLSMKKTGGNIHYTSIGGPEQEVYVIQHG